MLWCLSKVVLRMVYVVTCEREQWEDEKSGLFTALERKKNKRVTCNECNDEIKNSVLCDFESQ
jgi:hypothetical protein